jgi:hypothetical protein
MVGQELVRFDGSIASWKLSKIPLLSFAEMNPLIADLVQSSLLKAKSVLL